MLSVLLAPDRRPRKSKMIMKKTRPDEENNVDDLRPEYKFDYRNAKSNRFALTEQQRVVILLSPRAEYSQAAASVNQFLRSLI